MLYFTTETLGHGEKSIDNLTTRAGECRTENREPQTDNRFFLPWAHYAVSIALSPKPYGLIFTILPGSCWRAF